MDEGHSIVEACIRYWRHTHVPKQAIAEMREELASHLRDAVDEGKPVESVGGEDVTAFAEQWAREYRPPFVRPSSWARVGPAFLALLLGGWMVRVSASIDSSMEYVSGECCPWVVVERTTLPHFSGEFLYGVAIAAAALSILAAVALLLRQVAWGSAALVLGAIATAIMPPGWVVSLLLIAVLFWAQWVARRAYRGRAPALTA
jgi:hypothetical protein